jgi:hypothetical protein
MLMKTRSLFALFALALTTACASHDGRDHYALGGANEANIALQSTRDVALKDERAVESTSGQRAAKAVKALNDGEAADLRKASSTGSTQ